MKKYAPKNPLERTSSRRISGQGLTEYIIIVALIAIASIVTVSFFGATVMASFLALGTDLVGGEKIVKADVVSDSLAHAKTSAEKETTLQNYND